CLSLSPTLLSPPAAPSQLSPLSLHDALPISSEARGSVPGPDAALSLALPCSGCRLVPGAALFRDPPEIERHPPPAAPSVGPMTFTVLDTAAGMREVLTASPDRREDRLRQMLAPMQDMYRYFPGEVDLVALHAMGQGFPLEGRTEEVLDAVDQLEEAEAWTRIEVALQRAAAVQKQALPEIEVPDIFVLLVLGDPADEGFMGLSRGVTGNGSMTGYIQLTIWPTAENLARLEAAAVHEL